MPNRYSLGDMQLGKDAQRMKLPALVRPTWGEENQSARERYDVVAANIFGNVQEVRDLEIFKTQCLRYVEAEKIDELRGLISKWKANQKREVSMDFKHSETGNTPAMIAATKNNKEILNLLLEHGPDLTLRNNGQETAVHLAKGELQTLMLSKKLHSDLIHAAWLGNVKAVRNMLRRHFDVNNKNADGLTPLLLATRDINFFEKLPAIKDYQPLEVVKTLLEHKANVNHIDLDGRSVMHHLVENTGFATKGIASQLISKIKRIDHQDAKDLSPLHLASKLGDIKIVEILLNRGASVSCKSADGKTPLHYAVLESKDNIVQLLLSRKADPQECDNDGQSPLDIAKKNNNQRLIEMLKKARQKSAAVSRIPRSLSNFKDFPEVKNQTNLASEHFTRELTSEITSSTITSLHNVKHSKSAEERSTTKYPIKIQPLEFHATPSDSSPRMSRRSTSAKKAASLPSSFKIGEADDYIRQWIDDSGALKDCEGARPDSSNTNLDTRLPELVPSGHASKNDTQQREEVKSITPETAPPNKKSKIFTDAVQESRPIVKEVNKSKLISAKIPSAKYNGTEERKSSLRAYSSSSNLRNLSPSRLSTSKFRKASAFSARASIDLETSSEYSEKASDKTTAVRTLRLELGSPTTVTAEETKQSKKPAAITVMLGLQSTPADPEDNIQSAHIREPVTAARRGVEENVASTSVERPAQMPMNTFTPSQRSEHCEGKENSGPLTDRPCDLPDAAPQSLLRSVSDERRPSNACLPSTIQDSSSIARVGDIELLRNNNENLPIDCVLPQLRAQAGNITKKQATHRENRSFVDRVANGKGQKPAVSSLFENNCFGGEGRCSYQLKVPEVGLKIIAPTRVYQVARKKESGLNQRVKYRMPKQQAPSKRDAKKSKKRAQGNKSKRKNATEERLDKREEKTKEKNQDLENNNAVNNTNYQLPLGKSFDSNNNDSSCCNLENLSEKSTVKEAESVLNLASNDFDRMSISPDSIKGGSFAEILKLKLAEEDGSNQTQGPMVVRDEIILPINVVSVHESMEMRPLDLLYKEITEIAFDPEVNTVTSSGPSRRVSKCESPTRSSSISTQGSSDGSECGQEELQGWTKGNIIGSGFESVVYRGLTNRGKIIAVKQVQLNRTQGTTVAENQYRQLQSEIEILKSLTHRYIVKFIGTTLEENIFNIFMEFVPGGSLAVNLRQFGPLKEKVFQRYTRQLISAVVYLHSNGIVHRDIKGANIMLTPGGIIKLVDFGHAKRLNLSSLSDASRKTNSVIGTPFWMAPEVIRGMGHVLKSDIWSIGCTVYEFATGDPPWGFLKAESHFAAMYAIASYDTEIPKLPDQFSSAAKDFVARCLIRKQDDRPSADELRHHKFIELPGGYRLPR